MLYSSVIVKYVFQIQKRTHAHIKESDSGNIVMPYMEINDGDEDVLI